MKLDDFDYQLPPEQIAQAPLRERDGSRLLTLDKSTGAVGHRRFKDIPSLLREGDLLVVNDTRVVPARLLGHKTETGGQVELLVLRPSSPRTFFEAASGPLGVVDWLCMGRASKGLYPGAVLGFAGGLEAQVVERQEDGTVCVRFKHPRAESLAEALREAGQLPLPPYIERSLEPEDSERYQTVYASAEGSVAAPTAGLHFSPAVLEAVKQRGVGVASLTLEVGAGTFLPVRDDDVDKHRMHPESFSIPGETAEAVNCAKREGRRVVAVGTTVVRALESAAMAAQGGPVAPGRGETSLFIRPGFRFQVVDALLTNFHLPKSTLLMLVCAFAGAEKTLSAYRAAVSEKYRFFSYGDAMWIFE
jgi:S-adenosylmethionine:tRNA ribosyltransferase-isomerase